MATKQAQFVVDENGKRTAALVDIERYSELLEAQEKVDAIRAFDEAKASNDEAIPLAQATLSSRFQSTQRSVAWRRRN